MERPTVPKTKRLARAVLADLEDRQKRLLRDVHLPDALHPLLALFLLFEQLAFARNVSAVALGDDVLADRRDGFARHDLRADRRLDRYLEHLPRNQLPHLRYQRAPAIVSEVAMDDDRERIDRLARDQDVQLHHRRLPRPRQVVIERSIAARHRLEPVVEVQHDLVQRQLVGEHHPGGCDVLEVLLPPAFFLDQLEDSADILLIGQDHRRDDRLFHRVDLTGIGPARRVLYLDNGTIGQRDLVAHAGRGGDEVKLVLPLQPLLDDLHVQQPEEAAAKAEAKRSGALRLEEEGRIVEAQLLEGVAQQRVLVRVDGIETREDHRLDVLKARKLGRRRARLIGDGVADLGVGDILDVRYQEADFASGEFLDLDRFGRQHAHRLDVEGLAVRHEPDLHALAYLAMDDTGEHDDAAIGVEPGVEDECLQRSLSVPGRWRQPVHDGLEDIRHPLPRLRADRYGIRRVDTDCLLDHLLGAPNVRAGQIDL